MLLSQVSLNCNMLQAKKKYLYTNPMVSGIILMNIIQASHLYPRSTKNTCYHQKFWNSIFSAPNVAYLPRLL